MKRTQTKDMIYHKLSSNIVNKKTFAAIKEQNWK
jgi:hypothetical protein